MNIKYVVLIFVTGASLLAYQNCSKVNFAHKDPITSLCSSGEPCVCTPDQIDRILETTQVDVSISMSTLSAHCVDGSVPDPVASYQQAYSNEFSKTRFLVTCAKRECVTRYGANATGILKSTLPATYSPSAVGLIDCRKPVIPEDVPSECSAIYTDIPPVEHKSSSIANTQSVCQSLGPLAWQINYVKACGKLLCQSFAAGFVDGYLTEWGANNMSVACFRDASTYNELWGNP